MHKHPPQIPPKVGESLSAAASEEIRRRHHFEILSSNILYVDDRKGQKTPIWMKYGFLYETIRLVQFSQSRRETWFLFPCQIIRTVPTIVQY